MNFPFAVYPPAVTAAMYPMCHEQHGRKKPYTEAGIRRMPCFRCGASATQQWSICADDNLYRPICNECDILLNKLVLWFMRDPDWETKLAKYQETLE